MKFTLFILLIASTACIRAQTKLPDPIVALPPAAGGTGTFTPFSDVGSSLGTAAKRWNLLETRTATVRTIASGTKLVQVTGNGVVGIDAIGDNTFNLSTVVGTGFFGGGIAVCDVIVTAPCVTFVVPAGLASSYGFTMAPSLPVSTQFLKVSATGVWSFSTGSSIVCGTDKQVLYNDATVCGADANLTWDKTTKFLNIAGSGRLGINSASPGSYLDVRGSTGIGGSPIIVEETGAFGYSAVTYKDSAAADRAIIGWSNTFAVRSPSSLLFYTPSSDPMNFSIGATVQATISTTGLFTPNLSATALLADGGLIGENGLAVRTTTTASFQSFVALNLNTTDGTAIYGENRHGTLPVAELLSNSTSAGAALRLRSLGSGDLIQNSSSTVLDKNMNLFVNSVNSFSAVLTLNGAATANGNILLRPGNVAANASVYAIAPRLDQPAFIIQDAAGTTTGNSQEWRTNGGAIYAKMIGGSDPGAPGQLGTGGFFCITSGTCNLGFTTNRFVHIYGKELNASTASGQALTATTSDAFSVGATIDNTGGGSALLVSTNCASCIAFGMTNANAAGVQIQFGPGGGVGNVNEYVNNGVPGFACNTGDRYTNKTGGAGSTLYVCRGGAWFNIA